MTYAVILPATGIVGWGFLKKTADKQMDTLGKQAQIRREETYFRENIGKVTSAEGLMSDRRLLRVALESFGLQDDLPNRAFIRQVLEQGSLDPKALANKLSDKRYLKLSAAFGFDLTPPRTKVSTFADGVIEKWKARRFEEAVGDQDQGLRLGLNARRELAEIAKTSSGENAKWYTILGQPPLREVFEGAFGLPKAFGVLPVERQKDILIEKSRALLGSGDASQFKDPDRIETLVRRFLVRTEVNNTALFQSRGSAALTLLQQATPLPR